MRKTLFNAFAFLSLLWGIALGCTSTKNIEEETRNLNTTQKLEPSNTNEGITEEYGMHVHYQILRESDVNMPLKSVAEDSLPQSVRMSVENKKLSKDSIRKELGLFDFSETKSAVANKMVEHYLNSEEKSKTPGGHCLTVSKARFEKAYKEVHGHSLYQDLPDSMATKTFTPKQVFNMLYASTSEPHQSWRSLPEKYRGKGNAGAIAYAGMGTLVDSLGIWNGHLKPGALMQVWWLKEDYELVVQGVDVKKLDPYGHSFIFMGYVLDENNSIVGIKIADQGFQSYRPLVPRDYEVWWAVNLSI